jgi:hypothetical protein
VRVRGAAAARDSGSLRGNQLIQDGVVFSKAAIEIAVIGAVANVDGPHQVDILLVAISRQAWLNVVRFHVADNRRLHGQGLTLLILQKPDPFFARGILAALFLASLGDLGIATSCRLGIGRRTTAKSGQRRQ